jgi:hypothetical protein
MTQATATALDYLFIRIILFTGVRSVTQLKRNLTFSAGINYTCIRRVYNLHMAVRGWHRSF